MKINQITEQISVSPQIKPDDVIAIKAAGFKSIICNRPDAEENNQPNQWGIKTAATKQGLEFKYQPINNTDSITMDDVQQFGSYINALPGPVLAYCRTGTRSTILWSLSQIKQRSLPEILKLTQAAGYDMSEVARLRVGDG